MRLHGDDRASPLPDRPATSAQSTNTYPALRYQFITGPPTVHGEKTDLLLMLLTWPWLSVRPSACVARRQSVCAPLRSARGASSLSWEPSRPSWFWVLFP